MKKNFGQKLLRVFGWIVLGLAILVAGCFIWQTVAVRADAKAHPAPGKMIDMGGYHLHLYCTGEKKEGASTVILTGGSQEWSIHWQLVQPIIARTSRVCSYDRAGLGWSDPGPMPRSGKALTWELDTLLQKSGEAGPYVLVAHSLWGPVAVEYQQEHPDEVSGMVLVETWSSDMFSPVPTEIAQMDSTLQMMKVLSTLGIERLLGETGVVPLDEMLKTNVLPDAERDTYRAAYYSPEFWDTFQAEYAGLDETANELRMPSKGSMGALPLVVLEAGQRPADDIPSDEVWKQILTRQSEYSTAGRLELVPDSGHYIQLEKPEIVEQAILEVLAK